jgi:TatD DNase family protein
MAARFPEVVDTHAHLCSADFDDDREQVAERARQSGVGFIEVGYDESSSAAALKLAEYYKGICAVGIHPHYAEGEDSAKRWSVIESLAVSNPKTVRALGEMGLDYFRDLVPRDIQIECLREGLTLAGKLGLPVIIHQRDAEGDVLHEVRLASLTQPLVFHCFSQDGRYARKCLDLGGYFGIGGVLTYPKNVGLRQLMRELPLDRLLLETDCPYLPTQTRRGKRNEPSFVIETLETLSEALGMDRNEVARITTENASRVFGASSIRQSSEDKRESFAHP